MQMSMLSVLSRKLSKTMKLSESASHAQHVGVSMELGSDDDDNVLDATQTQDY